MAVQARLIGRLGGGGEVEDYFIGASNTSQTPDTTSVLPAQFDTTEHSGGIEPGETLPYGIWFAVIDYTLATSRDTTFATVKIGDTTIVEATGGNPPNIKMGQKTAGGTLTVELTGGSGTTAGRRFTAINVTVARVG